MNREGDTQPKKDERETQSAQLSAKDLLAGAMVATELDEEKYQRVLNLFDALASAELIQAIEYLPLLRETTRNSSASVRVETMANHLKTMYYGERFDLQRILKRASLTDVERCELQNALAGIPEQCVFLNPRHR